MNGTIRNDYEAKINAAAKGQKAKQAGVPSSSFLEVTAEMAAQAGLGLDGRQASGMGGALGMMFIPGLMGSQAIRSAGQAQTESVEAVTPEELLKVKYPGLHYHVFDASSSYWRVRNDYPHYLLYQDGDAAKETLENWRPSGENPFYGSIDGRFIAPKAIHALGSVPPGSKAVVIHPDVQARMEQDADYAKQIMEKIETWFTFDAARNEAIIPGISARMSQAVAIGADGNICNACASSAGGGFTYSTSGTDETDWWELRIARHMEFMKLAAERQLKQEMLASEAAASQLAKTQLAEMLNGKALQAIFGEEIAGVPTTAVLAITQSQIWGNGPVR